MIKTRKRCDAHATKIIGQSQRNTQMYHTQKKYEYFKAIKTSQYIKTVSKVRRSSLTNNVRTKIADYIECVRIQCHF